MSKIIPNGEVWVGFNLTCANISAPTLSEINSAVDLTALMVSLNAMAQGNSVPTPSFDSLFETNIVGTTSATFSADFYRDDVVANDIAWATLPRGTSGFFFIARYNGKPSTAGTKLEVWPVRVLSRSMANMANNTVETFTVTCAVPSVPNESATAT